jgi:hypothetical protein
MQMKLLLTSMCCAVLSSAASARDLAGNPWTFYNTLASWHEAVPDTQIVDFVHPGYEWSFDISDYYYDSLGVRLWSNYEWLRANPSGQPLYVQYGGMNSGIEDGYAAFTTGGYRGIGIGFDQPITAIGFDPWSTSTAVYGWSADGLIAGYMGTLDHELGGGFTFASPVSHVFLKASGSTTFKLDNFWFTSVPAPGGATLLFAGAAVGARRRRR